MTFNLNEKQLRNLNIFLNRVNLRGNEAVPMVELQQIFSMSNLQQKDDPSEVSGRGMKNDNSGQ